MTAAPPPSTTPTPEPSVGGRGWFVAATLVVLAAGAGGAWWFLFGGRDLVAPAPESRPVPAAGKPYVAAEHLDAATARLVASPDGRRTLDLDVHDVKPGESLVVRRRETGKASTSVLVFLSVGAPEALKDDPGVLKGVTATVSAPGVTHLRIELEGTIDRVTVVDLRFGGTWQGLEVAREGAPPAR